MIIPQDIFWKDGKCLPAALEYTTLFLTLQIFYNLTSDIIVGTHPMAVFQELFFLTFMEITKKSTVNTSLSNREPHCSQIQGSGF